MRELLGAAVQLEAPVVRQLGRAIAVEGDEQRLELAVRVANEAGRRVGREATREHLTEVDGVDVNGGGGLGHDELLSYDG